MVRRAYIKFLSLGISFSSWLLGLFQRAMAYQALSVFAEIMDGDSHIILLNDDCSLDEAYAQDEDEPMTREHLRTWKHRIKVPNDDC